jgi:hypothetical protein
MGLFHVATITPSKEDLIADWAPRQPWGPAASAAMEFVGAYRFDDPEGNVGMETFLARSGGDLFQIPLTYRDAPLEGGDDALISTMNHSALGTRWVYDGLRDPRFVVMMAAVAMTGQGEALGMALHEGRWYVAPSKVRIEGGGWTRERVPVDGFALKRDDDVSVTLANDRFELTVFRRPRHESRPPIGLTATWVSQPNPVVLAEVRDRKAPS